MTITTLLGLAATAYGLASVVSPLLQLRTMHRSGSSRDVSLGSLGIAVGGSTVWLTYGVALSNVALVVVDLGTLLTGLATLAVALRLRARQRHAQVTVLRHPAQPSDAHSELVAA